LISVRTGALLTLAIAARKARVRSTVDEASTLTTPREPTMKPVLLMYQLPSGCT
jgi:hypothetical protein